MQRHDYNDLIQIFNSCFVPTYNTQLVKGEDEPIYLPAEGNRTYHAIFFAHGYFSSALHECAHWLIAGEERRQLIDFGYWYVPDGRTAEQQHIFQQMEVKPQALEWILSKASKHPFHVSIDNLSGEETDATAFKQAVHAQVNAYCSKGLNARMQTFHQALCAFYGVSCTLSAKDFSLDEL